MSRDRVEIRAYLISNDGWMSVKHYPNSIQRIGWMDLYPPKIKITPIREH